ncbi:hypothetical protein BJY04DRAFT_32222 [Aspergillus karnatakaensis]|uniref:putative carbonyl reductase n=1 Tax=Aspergillus karnatakaensis TaxID=1810916 RepID=UPI003CCDA4C5
MSGVPINAHGRPVPGNSKAPAHSSLHSKFSLKGKTAIVTGAGAGLGLTGANGLAEAGANVALWYTTGTKCPERAQEIADKYGVQAQAYQVNITDPDAVKHAVEQSVIDFNGRLDIFIANAGIPWTEGPAVNGPLTRYSDVVEIDLNGTYYCAKYAAYYWRKQKEEGVDLNGNKLEDYTYGSFVATPTMSGHKANISQLKAAYDAAKSGIIHLCKSLALEWVKFARANTVSPGYIATETSSFVPTELKNKGREKIPKRGEDRAEELKGAYLYLASDASSYTTGSDLAVDGS